MRPKIFDERNEKNRRGREKKKEKMMMMIRKNDEEGLPVRERGLNNVEILQLVRKIV